MPAKISAAALKEIEAAYSEYVREVELRETEGVLQTNTAKTYLLHAGNFVKWLKGNFTPGGSKMR